jgi:hypothetical protein
MMDTWLVFVTIGSVWGRPADAQAAERIQDALTERAGRTGEPGIDPLAEPLVADRIRIRQTFPMVSAWQACGLAEEGLRRMVKRDEIESVTIVKRADWLRRGGH